MPQEMRTDRGTLSPDVSAVSYYEAVNGVLSPPPAPGQYRVLRAEEVQCMAAANSPLGNLYASEAKAAMNKKTKRRGQEATCMQNKLLTFRSIEQRNKSAGMALEVYYSLAEAEASRDVLQRGVAEVDRAIANLDQLKQSGLKVPMDQSALRRQKLDWQDRLIQFHSGVYQMQGQLQQLCGLDVDPCMLIWPQADLVVTVTPVCVETAVAEGLANRADVCALRMLNGSASVDTLSADRSGVAGMGPGLGTAIAAKRLLGGKSGKQSELETRQEQLSLALASTEQAAQREIGEAACNVETRLREIAVAKERLEVWKQRVADLTEKRQADGVTAFDISAAQLETIRAESDLVHRVLAWKIAQAKLKQAQGLLAPECGYCLPDCCR
jgi:outer membrane protein TolC